MSGGKAKPSEVLDRYLLCDDDCGAGPAVGRPLQLQASHWQARELYLSDIALVAVMEPCERHRPVIEHREELYRLLRRIGHLAMQHDLMRPVACVLPEEMLGDAAEAVRGWGGEQGWHRGAFTLYVEPERRRRGRVSVADRVADLLAPEPRPLKERREPRDPEALLKTFIDGAKAQEATLRPEVQKLFAPLARAVADTVRQAGSLEKTGEEDQKHRFDELDDWQRQVLSGARDAERSDR
jgi:hypothetical protein